MNLDRDEIERFLEALPLPTVMIDRAQRITGANGPARKLLGRGLAGRNYISALRQPALLDAVEGAMRTDGRRETTFLSMDGLRDATWHVTAAPLREGVLLSFEDRTPMQEADQVRRDFVANVSHELRTPLTALSGFIETLRGAARDDVAARDRFLGIMEREAHRMNRLIGDLLSLSRVEAQARQRPLDPVDLAALLRSARSSLAPMAEEAGAALTFDIRDAVVTVPGDADQLSQVIANLLENAVKYGGSRIEASLQVETHSPLLHGPAARLEVADDGAGIDNIHLPRLTERFYRVDSDRSREKGGTGLGLAIVKHIVGRHRGRLRIHSMAGQGSRFIILLPLRE